MLRAYAGVARAPFLLLPVVLVAVGAAASAVDGRFDLPRTLVALVGLVAMHVAVNAFNEVSDFARGIDLETAPTPFSGGSKTLPEGRLSPTGGRAVALAGAAVGAGVGIWFLLLVGWKLLPILFLGALATLAYSDLLARAYVGELFAGLGLGTLPVLGAALVQDGALGPTAWAASVPAFFMTFDLLLLNEFPDEAADRRGGRRNLVLGLGRRGAAFAYLTSGLLAPATIAVAVAGGWLPMTALWATAPSLLLIAPTRWTVATLRGSHEPVPIPALGTNVAWNLATNAVLAACLAVAA